MPPFPLGADQAFLALWLKLTYAGVTSARYRSMSAWIYKNGGPAPFRRALNTSTVSIALKRSAECELTVVVVDFCIFRNIFILLDVPPLVIGRHVYVDRDIIATFKHHQQNARMKEWRRTHVWKNLRGSLLNLHVHFPQDWKSDWCHYAPQAS